MKHVLYVNTTSVHGGAEEVLLYTMQAVRACGIAPVLVVPAQGWLSERCQKAGIPVEVLASLPDAFAVDTLAFQLRYWIANGRAIARIARRWGASLVHANSPRASYHSGIGARLAGIPAVTHVHDAIPARLPYSSPLKAKLLLRLTDQVIAVSQAVAEAIVGQAPALLSRVSVVYNGWDAAVYAAAGRANLRAELQLATDTLLVGTVSAMFPWKGQDLLVRAFALLHQVVPDAHLIMVGSSQGGAEQQSYERYLHQLVAELGLAPVVHFMGWREDVWAIMRDLDLFVHVPTQPDPLPTVLIHASALGCLIVAARIGGIPEIVVHGESGLLVPPNDKAALATMLSTVLADRAAWESLRAQARQQFARRFSRTEMLNGLISVYERCLPALATQRGAA